MDREINTLKLSMTDAQIERAFADDYFGLNVQHDDAGQVWFETTQPEARACTDIQCGDRVILIAMGDNGALGQGSTYIAEIEDIEPDRGMAWIVGR